MANPQTPAPQPGQHHPAGATSTGPLVVSTLVVAVVALVVALAGVVVSAIALGRSADAEALATKQNNQVVPAAAETSPPATEPTTVDGVPPPTDDDVTPTPTDISPTAQFTVAYEGQHLRLRSVACHYTDETRVDLDEPRVAGENEGGTELGYAGCSPGSLSTGLAFAEVSSPAATPQDCLETIRTDPGRAPVAPKRGMTLCIVTDQNEAAAQGISHKLAFVTIDSISVDNGVGVLNITVKAWTVPQ